MDQFHTIKISPRYRNMYRVEDHVGLVWGWACEHFGDPGQTPSGFRWQWDTHNTYYFRDEADAVLFALRWA
jgi:hypothetical protein